MVTDAQVVHANWMVLDLFCVLAVTSSVVCGNVAQDDRHTVSGVGNGGQRWCGNDGGSGAHLTI